jgi:hypothetical protein
VVIGGKVFSTLGTTYCVATIKIPAHNPARNSRNKNKIRKVSDLGLITTETLLKKSYYRNKM